MNFDTERFIFEIQCRPSIWDVKSTHYSNRDLKKKCWEELVDLFGGTEMSFGDKKDLGLALQKRWKGIRSCYTREMKRQTSVKSGSAAERKSEYIYFKQLQFLQRDFAETDTPVEVDIEETNEDVTSIRSKQKTTKKRKLDEETSGEDPFIATLNRSMIETREPRDQDYDDEDRMFLLSLLSSLRNVPPDKKLATKIKLMTVLEEATQGNSLM